MEFVDGLFKNALIWHLENEGLTLAEVCRHSGVSRGALTKVKLRAGATTTVENALRVAHCYGKTLEQFLKCEIVLEDNKLLNLVELLEPSEAEALAAQIEFLIAKRAKQSR